MRSPVGVIACGALAFEVQSIARRQRWNIDVHPIQALLHNDPERIAPALEAELDRLGTHYERIVVAYADCGSYGAIDDVLARRGIPRLSGNHCYDVFAGDEVAAALAAQPGTYFLTDFLARTFEHTVIHELGLDRHPELRDDYFRHYTRVVWLAQRPTPATHAAAERAAARLGLPLEVVSVGTSGLEAELARLMSQR